MLTKIISPKTVTEIKYGHACKNQVEIRLHDREPYKMSFMLDIHLFPLYCPHCGGAQPKLYWHRDSHYGFVGKFTCEFCGKVSAVWDYDNVVNLIFIRDYNDPSKKICFSELYLLDPKFIAALEQKYRISIRSLLVPYNKKYIEVSALREIIESAIGISTDGSMRFLTDSRFALLPDDINRWIELLYRAGISIEATVL